LDLQNKKKIPTAITLNTAFPFPTNVCGHHNEPK
jgi:hypothetical protein